MEGVTDYRIQNRIATMKLFYDTWDMNRLYSHVKNGNFVVPEYAPLKDTEMAGIKQAIKSTANRVIGSTRSSTSALRTGTLRSRLSAKQRGATN